MIRASKLVGAKSMEEVFAAKAKIKQEDVNEISLRLLIAFDAAKRSRCPPSLANFLTKHLIMAIAIGSQMRNQTFSELCKKAYAELYKACMRDTVDLDLTTKEYQTIRRAIVLYVNHLPKVELGLLDFAAAHAEKALGR